MKSEAALATAILSTALLLLPSLGVVSADVTYVGGTTSFSLVGPATLCTLGGQRCVHAVYRNNLNSTTLAIMILVLHNSLGQTVYYSTATMSPAAASNGEGYAIISGVSPGNYNATIFMMSPYNIALSTSTSLLVAI